MRWCATSGRSVIARPSPARKPLTSSLSPAARSPTATTTGRCACWRAKRSSSASSSVSPRDHPGAPQKNELKPWRHRQWCIPTVSGEFVAAMEDVLALYALPYDARYPTVCLDEKPVVLHAEVRSGLPLAPGHVERRDYEYERHGTANLFVMVGPLAGWRHVAVTERRTKRDYAEVLRYLVEERYPGAECICVGQDNLNTPTSAPLYQAFPAH